MFLCGYVVIFFLRLKEYPSDYTNQLNCRQLKGAFQVLVFYLVTKQFFNLLVMPETVCPELITGKQPPA